MTDSDTKLTELSRLAEGTISELTLDRYHHGELSAAEMAKVRAEIEADPSLQKRMAEREQGFSAYPEFDAQSMVARIHVATANVEASSSPESLSDRFLAWFRAPQGSWSLVAGAAALALVVVIQRVPQSVDGGAGEDGVGIVVPQPGYDIRSKGQISLNVFRLRNNEVTVGQSGDEFAKGDRLRFQVSLPRPAHVMIVGVEADGSVYAAYPAQSSASVQMDAGIVTLGEAVELDAQLGREVLHLVACPKPFALGDFVGGQAGSLQGFAPDCTTTQFEMNKAE